MAEKKRSRVLSVVLWVCALVCAGLCCGWVYGGVFGDGVWYWFDLAGAFTARWVLGALVIGGVSFVLRRWRVGVVCVIAAGVGLWPVMTGRSFGVGEAGIGVVEIRVGTFNIYPKNEVWESDMGVLLGMGLDVLVIQEPGPELSRGIRLHGYLEGSGMEHWVHRAWVKDRVSPGFIISRYELELIEVGGDELLAENRLMCVVHHPEGAFVVGLMHPLSPRTVDRWMAGNRVVRAQRRWVNDVLEETGLPMIAGLDLNAARGQYRERELRRSGLRSSKPLTAFDWGSYPASGWWLSQVQLDDLWRSEGVDVVGWEMVRLSGSDHLAVVGGFVLGGGSAEDSGSD